jgi:enamine deaminase RidA (YjgF/YER057c/UK114 family)
VIRIASILGLGLLLFAPRGEAQRKKPKKEEITQTLELPKDPPAAVTAETARLVFHVTPLSANGLLSQQVRDGLKILMKDVRGANIVKLRAFVAGSGDMRRVQTIVSETFTDKKISIPAVSTIQVGGLPLTGAQVILESISVDKKVVNPQGLAFVSGEPAASASDAISKLKANVSAMGVKPASALRITCFLNSLDDVGAVRAAVAAAFPSAAANYVQMQRVPEQPVSACEAIARLDMAPASGVLIMSDGKGAAVNAAKLVFTGTQMAFQDQDSDIRLAFDRLGKVLQGMNVSYKDVFWSGAYPLSRPVAEKTTALRSAFFDPARPPAGTMLIFEGLPSLDASVALEVIAAGR